MSRASRTALAVLSVALVLAPAAAVHPVVAHLYAGGIANLSIELTHRFVLVSLAVASLSAFPAVGFTVVFLRAAGGIPSFRGLLAGSSPARLGALSYRALSSEDVLIFTAGLLRPVTFVSTGAQRAFDDVELRAALLHEEAHRRGRDVAWRLLLQAIASGFAFIPWVRRVVEIETLRTECAADDYAIKSGARRLDLFEAIVAASTPVAGSLAVGLTDADVELRLRRLADPNLPLPGRPAGGLLVLAAAVLIPAITAHVVAMAAAAGSASHLM